MESLRVRTDDGDPCPDCGAPATVYERVDDALDAWIEELRECCRGCSEIAVTLKRSTPPRSRKRAVA
jgi:hypothetical protein